MKYKVTAVLITAFLIIIPVWGQQTASSSSGQTSFLLSGYGFINFENEDGSPSNFESGFAPIFLWKVNDRIFFEGEAEFELEDGGTNVGLEYAQLFYVFNDYITVGGGKFLSPVNNFVERLHPTWINKLPTMPLGLSSHGGVPLLAGTQIGVQARGGVDAGGGKITYSVYLSNGPTLNVAVEDSLDNHGEGALYKTTDGDEGEDGHGVSANGTLNFSNTNDNNDNKAIGGRISFIPFSQFEIGVGIESATVGSKDTPFSDMKAMTNAVDIALTRDLAFLKGRVDLRGQYIRLKVDNPDAHPLEFDNESNAYYAQFAYQPADVESTFLKNIELVTRFDKLDLPEEAPLNIDIERVSLGLNYWFAPSTVFKIAYESITSIHEDEEETGNMLIGQFSIGF